MNDWDKHEGPTVTSCLQLKLWRTQRGHAGCSVQSAGTVRFSGAFIKNLLRNVFFNPETGVVRDSGLGIWYSFTLYIIKLFPVQMSYIATSPMDHEHA